MYLLQSINQLTNRALKHSAEVSDEVLRTADAWEQLNAFLTRNGSGAIRSFFSSKLVFKTDFKEFRRL